MPLDRQPVAQLLESIAAKQPTPGGGAVASLTAAIGAALAQMVVNYSLGKKKLAEHDELHEEAVGALEAMRREALDLADADAEAYGRLNELWKLDADDDRRKREFPDAVRAAIDVPQRALTACVDMLALLERLCGRTSRMLASDLAIAAVLAEAGARAAAWNVRVNLPLLEDGDEARRLAGATDETLDRAETIRKAVEEACAGDR